MLFAFAIIQAISFLLSPDLIPRTPPEDSKLTKPLAANSGVELTTISIVRTKRGYAFKEQKISAEMNLDLWLTYPEGSLKKSEDYFIETVKLKLARDNTGKSLITKDRLETIRRKIGREQTSSRGNKIGPVLSITLDAPSKQATHLRELIGTVRVMKASVEFAKFQNISFLAGKRLQLPNVEGVAITPTFEAGKGFTTVSLQIHGKQALIYKWGLSKDGQAWPDGGPAGWLFEHRRRGAVSGVVIRGQIPVDVDLDLVVLVPTHSHEFRFEIKDVELP